MDNKENDMRHLLTIFALVATVLAMPIQVLAAGHYEVDSKVSTVASPQLRSST